MTTRPLTSDEADALIEKNEVPIAIANRSSDLERLLLKYPGRKSIELALRAKSFHAAALRAELLASVKAVEGIDEE
jgi:hypothetical protein